MVDVLPISKVHYVSAFFWLVVQTGPHVSRTQRLLVKHVAFSFPASDSTVHPHASKSDAQDTTKRLKLNSKINTNQSWIETIIALPAQ